MEAASLILVAIGWAAVLALSAILAADREHPAARALRWNPRLFSVALACLAGLGVLAAAAGDNHYLRLYSVGLAGTMMLLVPAGLVHLWRSRSRCQHSLDQVEMDAELRNQAFAHENKAVSDETQDLGGGRPL